MLPKNFCFRINATKEVILSAGAVNSPQILMLSGVGPKADLDKYGIPTIQNLKVGYNLMDHVCLGGFNFLINTTDAITLGKLLNPGRNESIICVSSRDKRLTQNPLSLI